jgi:hypothetical protein
MSAIVGDVLRLVGNGMNSNEIEALILRELQDRQLMDTFFPMLTRFGIPDISNTVHSHFLTYLATLGQSLGFVAVADCPVVVATGNKWTSLGIVRPDSIWFSKEKIDPLVALEFERFEKGDEGKLQEKIENLAIAFFQSGRLLQRSVLLYWVRSGSSPRSLEPVLRPYQNGFTRRGYDIPPSSCPLTVVKCVLRGMQDRLIISEFVHH